MVNAVEPCIGSEEASPPKRVNCSQSLVPVGYW